MERAAGSSSRKRKYDEASEDGSTGGVRTVLAVKQDDAHKDDRCSELDGRVA